MATSTTLIIFDCDGTLVDSQLLIVESMRTAFQSAGLSTPERAAILRTVGLSIPEAVKALAPAQGPEAREALAQSYRNWYNNLRQQSNAHEQLFQGAAALLLGLAARDDVVLGIATGKSRRGVLKLIAQNNLQGIFSTIQTADDAPSKPHPAMLDQAIRETGSSPEATIMIGDTSYDMMMASYAKTGSIGVTWGYHSAGELQSAGAKTIVRSFSALEHALRAGHRAVPQFQAVA
jgi:phosphoglycolate phosphatase